METIFQDESYDKIVSTLVFSELSGDEQIYALRESKRLLKKQGVYFLKYELSSSITGNHTTTPLLIR